MRSIKRLPEAARSSMRSGVLLFDLTRVVEELVFNSLDAGATKVSVALGVETCCIKVADNGYGVTRDGLVLLGERYATSKFEQIAGTGSLDDSFGFRGEALGSISDVSILEIVTKAHGMPNGYRKVIKGCKCLYLGIDDDRQDVGTTVTVRDLFYNQPVRRKHLQSSPKKILHSVRETVLRIALVHLKVSLRVIDMESGEELLCTGSSSSPLALLTGGFGLEVSSSLHVLDVSDSLLRLSGYASVPSLTFSVKAVQCFYINSRFISKCPIHKLLNQLASRFIDFDAMKDTIECQKGKQSRCQMCATYILNLRCPRAHYDLTFEPSKTIVEFKDWDPVLGFIEDSVSHFWSQKISLVQEDSLIHAADKPSKESMWEEGAHTLATLEDLPTKEGTSKKRYMGQSPLNSHGLLSPKLARVSKESGYMSPWSNSRFSSGNSPEDGFLLKDQQTGTEFDFQTDFSFQPCDESFAKCRAIAPQESGSHVALPGRYVFSAQDHYNRNEFVIGRPNERVDLLSPFRWKFDSSKSSVRSCGFIEIANDVGKVENHRIPSLRSCSTQVSLIPGVPYFDNFEETKFHDDDFRRKKRLRTDDWDDIKEVNDIEHDIAPINNFIKSNGLSGDCFGVAIDVEKGNEYYLEPSLRRWYSPKSLLPDGGSGFRSDGFRKRKCAFSDDWDDLGDVNEQGILLKIDSNKTDALSSQHLEIANDVLKVNDDLKKPFLRSCSSRVNLLADGAYLSKFEGSGCRKKKKKVHFDDWNDNGEVNNIEQGTVWSSPTMTTIYDRRIGLVSDVKHFRYNKTAGSEYMLDTENIDDILNLNKVKVNSAKVPYSLSGFINSPLALSPCTSGKGDINKYQGDNILFPENSDNFLDVKNWLNFDSFHRSDKIKHVAGPSVKSSLSYLDKERSSNGHISLVEKMRGCETRSRRSSSAPPFCKGKKKFFALSNWSTIETGKSHLKTNHDTVTLQEDSDLEHIKNPSNIDVPSVNVADNYWSNARIDENTTADITETRSCEMEKHCFDKYNTASIEDFTSKEEGILDYGPKWRDSCPSTTNIKKSDVFPYQDNILNISSEILHLSGDSLIPKSISKKLLEDARVLQQVDRKFIPIVSSGTLAIIDQHAADERIRLEDLRQKVLSGKMKTITHLEAEKELVLPEIGYQLLHNYAEQIQKWGWICNFHSQSSKSFKRNLNILHQQPSVTTLLAVPCILGVNLTDVDLLEFLQQLADTDGSSTIPQAVLRVLNYKACRGAIMFGDKLLPSECSLIVEELKQTSLCFQCAHGRPTTVPLVDLNALHRRITKLEMTSSSGSVESWHGLQRHKPSIERAARRLNSD